MNPIIEEIEKEYEKKAQIPELHVGDKVNISNIIKEGKKQRIQHYEGIVIAKKHRLSRLSITVRKIIDSIGVEKTFLLHSPLISEIKILKKGNVRRAKLFYLRDRIGSSATFIKSKKD